MAIHAWPPKPPDVSISDFQWDRNHIACSINAWLHKLIDRPNLIFKGKGSQREYDLMKAVGNCAIGTHGRVYQKSYTGQVLLSGFLMDLAEPLHNPMHEIPKRPLLECNKIREGMIRAVLGCHQAGVVHGDIKLANMLLCSDGIVRLCDFDEGLFLCEDPEEWDGKYTTNYLSPRRCEGWRDSSIPPPTVEDDLYGLGLAIWELYTSKIPFEGNDDQDEIMDMVEEGKTVDVDLVEDEEAKEKIREFLRQGGAKV